MTLFDLTSQNPILVKAAMPFRRAAWGKSRVVFQPVSCNDERCPLLFQDGAGHGGIYVASTEDLRANDWIWARELEAKEK